MACHLDSAKPLSEPMMVSLPMHICVTRPQWVKCLRIQHTGLIWYHSTVGSIHNMCHQTFHVWGTGKKKVIITCAPSTRPIEFTKPNMATHVTMGVLVQSGAWPSAGAVSVTKTVMLSLVYVNIKYFYNFYFILQYRSKWPTIWQDFWHLKLVQVVAAQINSCVLLDQDNTWLTHWGRAKMAAVFQTTFWNAFSWMKMYEFRKRFHWSLLLRVQLAIFQLWFK